MRFSEVGTTINIINLKRSKKVEKQSFLSELEALEYISSQFENVHIKSCSCSCECFDCPRGLDSWSGETSGYSVIDNETWQEVATVVYWRVESDWDNNEVEQLKKQLS